MRAKLYSLSLSHPSHAARLMLERKRIEYELVDELPGFHPLQLRLAGFRGGTVPALKIDGRRVQGTRSISRALDELRHEPPLFPADPEARGAVIEAERWGEQVLQPVPRRIFRWGASHSQALRRWIVGDVVGWPAAGFLGRAQAPIASRFAHMVGADDDTVRADVAALPELLDRVDELIAAGTIGGEPNAADFQIATTVRVLLAYEDLRAAVEGRPAAELALRLQPSYPEPIPAALPAEWVALARS